MQKCRIASSRNFKTRERTCSMMARGRRGNNTSWLIVVYPHHRVYHGREEAKYCISRLYFSKKKIYIYIRWRMRAKKTKLDASSKFQTHLYVSWKEKNIQIFLAYEIILKIVEDDRNVTKEPPICWQCFQTTQESQYTNICDVILVSWGNERIEKKMR